MPQLTWVGKEKVVNYHLSVPFHTLKKVYDFGKNDRGNMIIHGDNMVALKSLLPEYEGLIDCVYIDPPYNTGNEEWVYNDNVNDPTIQKWLGEVVGKEGDDLSRHDKWLCMMYPRLKLLQKLLSKHGAIFISIDDNEQAVLKLICDEIFGADNFIAQFVWKRRASSAMALRNVSIDHEYVLCYGKEETESFLGLKKDYKGYSNPDNDPRGPWTTGDLTVGMTAEMRPHQFFDLVDPKTGIVYKPSPSRVWTYIPESMNALIADNRIVFPKDPSKRPMKKRFASELKTETNPISTWLSEVGINTEGSKAIKKIFGRNVFSYSKPESLIKTLIGQISGKNGIVLDAFAGSGTTGQAVIDLNKEDSGDRKFILVEMMDYANELTAERVKKIGGEFTFYELGPSLFLKDGLLNPDISAEELERFVWFTEIKGENGTFEPTGFYLGNSNGVGIFLCHGLEKDIVLGPETLPEILSHRFDSFIVYADSCILGPEELARYNIAFKKIPADIRKF